MPAQSCPSHPTKPYVRESNITQIVCATWLCLDTLLFWYLKWSWCIKNWKYTEISGKINDVYRDEIWVSKNNGYLLQHQKVDQTMTELQVWQQLECSKSVLLQGTQPLRWQVNQKAKLPINHVNLLKRESSR